jgi:uncharacterized membrane protein YraQ (UPF0718 family)
VSISQALYKKGASTEATLAFALASTNIVFELAVLIYVLLGGAVLAGEFLSGLMLIVIMYTLVHLTLPVKTFELARRRLQERDKGTSSAMRRLTAVGIWHRIADRYFRTLNRIGKSVAFGFFVAGFIAALMPARVWTVLFLAPRGFLAILENAMLGIGVGMLSMIGSIGIVPSLLRWLWVAWDSQACLVASSPISSRFQCSTFGAAFSVRVQLLILRSYCSLPWSAQPY